MAIAGVARTLDLQAPPTVGAVIGLYPRFEGVCALQPGPPPMDPDQYAAKYGIDGVRAVELIARKGMAGDRYALGTSVFSSEKRSSQLTLVAQEDLDEVEQTFGIRISGFDSLRNILTSGIALETLIGKRFRIGGALCLGTRLCEPCVSWEKYLRQRGIVKAFVHRTGIRADILQGATVGIGDPISIVGDAADLMIDRSAPSGVAMFMQQEDGTLLCGECGSPFGEQVGSSGEVICHRCGIVAPVSDAVRPGATIRILDDGSYNLTGLFVLTDGERNPYTVEGNNHLTLCRCGHSTTKPFCDSSHRNVGFASAPRVPLAGEESIS